MGTDGEPALLRTNRNNSADRWSEHGLGHLLNPTEPGSSDREWIAQAWLGIIRRALDLPTTEHDFACLPAIGRISISSPSRLSPFSKLNEGKPYAEQIKPFNFMLTCHVRPFGHPIGADPEHFHLIAPYQPDPRAWSKTEWVDQYTGNAYHITTAGHHGNQQTARVKTYGEVLREYEFHPESKCADAEGNPCGKQTIGLLQRRHVRIDEIENIGKESNSLEDVESGMIHAAESVYTEYPDPRHDEWKNKIVPALKNVSLRVLKKESRLSRRMLIKARTGRAKPHLKNQKLLRSLVRKFSVN